MSWFKNIFNKKEQKEERDTKISKKDIERIGFKLWNKSDGSWDDYLRAKKVESILSQRNGLN